MITIQFQTLSCKSIALRRTLGAIASIDFEKKTTVLTNFVNSLISYQEVAVGSYENDEMLNCNGQKNASGMEHEI